MDKFNDILSSTIDRKNNLWDQSWDFHTSFLCLTAATVFTVFFYKHYYSLHALPMPPGPAPLPLIGNLHQLTGNLGEKMNKWHRKYGPLISLRAGQRTIIVIGSYEIAHDLLDKRSATYSSRPKLLLAFEHLSRSMSMAVMPNTKQWQAHRRIVVSLLNSTVTKRYQHLQDIESKQVLHELLESNNFSQSFERYAASLHFTLAYGMRLESAQRPEISEMRYVINCLLDGMKNITMAIVELFPLLDNLPQYVAPWKQFWRDRHNRTISFLLKNLQYARTEQKSSWTWAREATKAQEHVGRMSDAEIAYLVGTMNEGGIETTPSSLRTAIKAILLHPAAMQRAQKEIDDIIGPNRLPTFEDMSQMPYVNALIKEVLRWQPLLPMGVPHSTPTNEEYMGYRIPKGSIILQNNYEMVYGINMCQSPYEFKPERWLESPDLQVFSAFGYGRRKCPGKDLAMNSIFIVISRILWAYTIKPVIRNGHIVEVDAWDIEHHFTSSPLPFEVSFQTRDDHRQRIIELEFNNMEKEAFPILQKVAQNGTTEYLR
jgi:cytochrome P450